MRQGEIAIIEGHSFVVSNEQGDITPGTAHGLFFADTRFLSGYVLRVNGEVPLLLSSRCLAHDSASFYSINRRSEAVPQGWLTITRDRVVANGLHEDLTVINHGIRSVDVCLTFDISSDFADVFEVRGAERAKERTVCVSIDGDGFDLGFSYSRAEFCRQALIEFSEKPRVSERGAEFHLRLAPQESWHTRVSIRLVVDGKGPGRPSPSTESENKGSFVGALEERATSDGKSAKNWKASVPILVTESATIQEAYCRAISDLSALRLAAPCGHPVPAAGLPWYLALFGRDSIITALQTLMLGPDLALGTLKCLAQYQGDRVDDFRDEQPGKMPHEIRTGELAYLDHVPHSRYYGTVDATPLYLVLLSETFRWTGDLELVRCLLPVAEKALQWIDHYGDLDGDGFVEYRRRSLHGLVNQGWKDSTDCVCFRDGTTAQGPIALAEVQGYVYDGKTRLAELYDLLGVPDRARLLRAQAEELKKRFDEAFWLPDEGYYAMALDGRKKRVDSVTSNPGHCLWSGIVPESKAAAVAARLMADDLFSGWGVRTLSSFMPNYNPVSYHNGSVWPHDNSIIAAGLRRYGFDAEARRIAEGLFDASAHFPLGRLPELFAGFPRSPRGFPVDYPEANAPQAWAAGAVISLLQTLLGVRPAGNALEVCPLPSLPRTELIGVAFRGHWLHVAPVAGAAAGSHRALV